MPRSADAHPVGWSLLVLSGRPMRLYINQPTRRSDLSEVLSEGLIDQMVSDELSCPLDDLFGYLFTVLGSGDLGVAVGLASVLSRPPASVGIACQIDFSSMSPYSR